MHKTHLTFTGTTIACGLRVTKKRKVTKSPKEVTCKKCISITEDKEEKKE